MFHELVPMLEMILEKSVLFSKYLLRISTSITVPNGQYKYSINKYWV